MIYFGERLRTLRLENRLTQSQLADRLGIVGATVSEYENCRKYPSVEVLIKLCGTLNVSSDYLLGLSDNKAFKGHQFTDDQMRILNLLMREFDETNAR